MHRCICVSVKEYTTRDGPVGQDGKGGPAEIRGNMSGIVLQLNCSVDTSGNMAV